MLDADMLEPEQGFGLEPEQGVLSGLGAGLVQATSAGPGLSSHTSPGLKQQESLAASGVTMSSSPGGCVRSCARRGTESATTRERSDACAAHTTTAMVTDSIPNAQPEQARGKHDRLGPAHSKVDKGVLAWCHGNILCAGACAVTAHVCLAGASAAPDAGLCGRALGKTSGSIPV